WRRIDLVRIVKKRFDVECHETTIGSILRELGFSHISPCPQHPKNVVSLSGFVMCASSKPRPLFS
ncbi:MAG: winged helix-turn-helix domain-containing protein, partial [Gammaproteobacteria bacterium]|nr:winged helix-turn-helix domain-containing protein [Gammaproteobacteria bacterium]